MGTNGWYTSQTTTTFKADDKTSGVDRVEYSQNNSAWQTGTSVVSKDGINSISVKTYDKAGNMLNSQAQVKVDTGMPTAHLLPPQTARLTHSQEMLPLSGTASIICLGSLVEISYDGGKTWVPLFPQMESGPMTLTQRKLKMAFIQLSCEPSMWLAIR
jgi:hypothetical protein